MCIKLCLQVLPVEGLRVSLGLTAKHHLSAILARLKGKHHTARLFGEHRPQQDSTSCVGDQQNYISFDVLVSLKTTFNIYRKQIENSAAQEEVESLFGMDLDFSY